MLEHETSRIFVSNCPREDGNNYVNIIAHDLHNCNCKLQTMKEVHMCCYVGLLKKSTHPHWIPQRKVRVHKSQL